MVFVWYWFSGYATPSRDYLFWTFLSFPFFIAIGSAIGFGFDALLYYLFFNPNSNGTPNHQILNFVGGIGCAISIVVTCWTRGMIAAIISGGIHVIAMLAFILLPRVQIPLFSGLACYVVGIVIGTYYLMNWL